MREVGGGLLAVLTWPGPGQEDELERWYEDDHLYERSAIDGILCSRRYLSLDGDPPSLALYELAAPEVVDSDAYLDARRLEDAAAAALPGGPPPPRMVNTIRNVYALRQSAGRHPGELGAFIWMVREGIAPEHEPDLDRWYEEHLPLVAAVPGVRGVTRYVATLGVPRYLVLYELATAEVTRSEAWRRAFDTPSADVRARRTEVATNLGQYFKAVYPDEARAELASWRHDQART
ncbi:MAG: hypothetical protein WD734_03050 [Dehalococcoidia bacterium]